MDNRKNIQPVYATRGRR